MRAPATAPRDTGSPPHSAPPPSHRPDSCEQRRERYGGTTKYKEGSARGGRKLTTVVDRDIVAAASSQQPSPLFSPPFFSACLLASLACFSLVHSFSRPRQCRVSIAMAASPLRSGVFPALSSAPVTPALRSLPFRFLVPPLTFLNLLRCDDVIRCTPRCHSERLPSFLVISVFLSRRMLICSRVLTPLSSAPQSQATSELAWPESLATTILQRVSADNDDCAPPLVHCAWSSHVRAR